MTLARGNFEVSRIIYRHVLIQHERNCGVVAASHCVRKLEGGKRVADPIKNPRNRLHGEQAACQQNTQNEKTRMHGQASPD